jgi:hypothetical protein
VILGTPGSQTITATDAAGELLPGSLVMQVTARTAVRLIVSNDFCLIGPCPATHAQPPKITVSGVPFGIYVAAVDIGNAIFPGYVGTAGFSGTDSGASLPPSYSFVPADRGRKAFTAILRTQGDQTITVSDPASGLIPGTLVMTVTAPAEAQAIPSGSTGMKILLVLALALSGIWLSRLRP